jgi:hypothetical protein
VLPMMMDTLVMRSSFAEWGAEVRR